jgi:hypothetical protein
MWMALNPLWRQCSSRKGTWTISTECVHYSHPAIVPRRTEYPAADTHTNHTPPPTHVRRWKPRTLHSSCSLRNVGGVQCLHRVRWRLAGAVRICHGEQPLMGSGFTLQQSSFSKRIWQCRPSLMGTRDDGDGEVPLLNTTHTTSRSPLQRLAAGG